MQFYEKQLFHIYNQGNNRRQIFFSDENYEFFLWKMRAYLLLFGDLVAWSGRLFKDNCQVKDGWIDEFVALKKNGKEDFRFRPGNDYGFLCFNYVHNNAVKAKMVKQAIDYIWSSARDYAGLRNGTLCNLGVCSIKCVKTKK